MQSIRVNKYLAHTLGMSRREADKKIQEGRVLINGTVAEIGNTVNPDRDTIYFEGQSVSGPLQDYIYLLLNKPVGYVCSRRQQGDAPTIYRLLPKHYHHLKVAGRLDKDSCGLIMLTNDGDAIFKLTHPKFKKEKIYIVGLDQPLKSKDLERINEGITLEDGKSNMKVKKSSTSDIPHEYTVSMSEGRNRQIRRTFKELGYIVDHLQRTKLGNYSLDKLKGKPYLQTTI